MLGLVLCCLLTVASCQPHPLDGAYNYGVLKVDRVRRGEIHFTILGRDWMGYGCMTDHKVWVRRGEYKTVQKLNIYWIGVYPNGTLTENGAHGVYQWSEENNRWEGYWLPEDNCEYTPHGWLRKLSDEHDPGFQDRLYRTP